MNWDREGCVVDVDENERILLKSSDFNLLLSPDMSCRIVSTLCISFVSHDGWREKVVCVQ